MRNLQVVALCLSLAKDCESIAISEALAFAATNWQVAPSVAGQFSNPLNNPDPPSDTNKDTTFPTAADNGRVPYLPATSCSQSRFGMFPCCFRSTGFQAIRNPLMSFRSLLKRISASIFASFIFCLLVTATEAQLVPGTGKKLETVGDDFEDPEWRFIGNWPKSTEENNDRHSYPSGKSANSRWYEGMKRGQPDFIRRVPTPGGGLVGSEGSLLIRSLQTGIPGDTELPYPAGRPDRRYHVSPGTTDRSRPDAQRGHSSLPGPLRKMGTSQRPDVRLPPCLRTGQPSSTFSS